MKKKFQQLYSQQPWLFTSLIVVIWLILSVVVGLVPLVVPTIDITTIRALGQIVLALAIGLIALAVGWQRVGSQAGGVQSKAVVLLGMFIAALPLACGLRIESAAWFAFIVVMELIVGFSEELAFRGLILQSLFPKGRIAALFASSLLFGGVHLVNILYGSGVGITLLQVLGASVFGFGLGAVVLRTGALWPAMLIHALANSALRFSWLTPDYLPVPLMNALVSTLLLLFGIVLLLRYPRQLNLQQHQTA
jgi:membrane protease YdiL (CAAX protease family)